MDTGVLRGFATRARTDLLREVRGRLDVVLGQGSSVRAEQPGAVAALERVVAVDGRESVVDRVAYTWFNRIVALRFMDANGYTAAGVVSPAAGKATGQPQVLADAKGGDFDTDVVTEKVQTAITALLNGTRPSTDPQGEAYGLLLEAYCRYWNKAMPFMFEREGDYTELLMPSALLATDSVRDRAVRTLTEEACSEVEVIGWLYQFYISDRKAEVFAGFKQNKKAGAAEIPAATQLFTPHWIVRYLVENSLGRLWLLNHPESRLAEQMDYYIEPVDEETDFIKIRTPEELKIIDPAAGSGHMLTYAFDLLYAIYEEESYSPSEIPAKILEHNLYGVEIDPRAGALAAFALTMKATAKRKLFLKNPVQPNICVLQNIHFDQPDLDYLWTLTKEHPELSSIARPDFDAFWNTFEHADTYGSLIQPNPALTSLLAPIGGQLESRGALLARTAAGVIAQTNYLSQRYHVAVANPPYMGSGNYSARLSSLALQHFPDSRQDLCTMFIERGLELLEPGGRSALIMPHSWMFLTSFASLRIRLLRDATLDSVVHLGRGVFGSDFASVAFVLDARPPRTESIVTYRKLYDKALAVQSNDELVARFQDRASGLFPVRQVSFLSIPGAPLVFSLGERRLQLFNEHPPLRQQGKVAVGLQTSNNPRFLRYWYEVAFRSIGFGIANREEAGRSGDKWFPYNKGGVPRRWWGNQELVVNWKDDGVEIRAERPRSVVRNPDFYFRPSVSWSNVGGVPAFRQYPAGFISDSAGSSFFPSERDRSLGIMAFLNSEIMRELLEAIAPTLHFDVGQVGSLPVPTSVGASDVAGELVALARADSSRSETSWEYRQSPLTEDGSGARLRTLSGRVREDAAATARRVRKLERANDQAALDVLGMSGDDRPQHPGSSEAGATSEVVDADYSDSTQTRELASFAVGCMFGRYSLDEPGVVLANQGDTLQEYLAKVPTPSLLPDQDNVIPILDGDWFEDDIVAKFRQFLRVAFGAEHFEENLKFVIDSLGVKDLRDYFTKSFYKDHVQRYKKRPIYWMFSSPKGSFNALIYLHRYTPSTGSTVLNEYLREFIKKLEVSLEQQEYIVTSGASAREVAAAQREADRLRKVLLELADYERDLFALAARQIPLDLDDGVLVNYQKLGTALKDIGLKKAGNNE